MSVFIFFMPGHYYFFAELKILEKSEKNSKKPWYVILYHKSNLVYTGFFPQFLIFQKNNSTETSGKLILTPGHYYFVKKLKIVEKNLCKLNCSYGKVSHALN